MSITIEIDSALENRLRQDAARQGLSIDQVIASFIERQMALRNSYGRTVSKQEAALLKKIDLEIDENTWHRFRALKEKMRDRTLTDQELEEYQAINERIEAANVARLRVLVELAKLRQVPLRQLMTDLGLNPETHE